MMYGHCEYGHYHGNEDNEDCPACDHPSEIGPCDECGTLVCGERFCDDCRFNREAPPARLQEDAWLAEQGTARATGIGVGVGLLALLTFVLTFSHAVLTTDAYAARPAPRVVLTCAVIDNTSNSAAWVTRSGALRIAGYRDNGGARLQFDRPVPRAVRIAERLLQNGPPGPKARHACA